MEDNKKFNTVEEAAEDLRQGKIIVVVDSPDRENEGDLICAARFASPENVNFMATYGKGLICMPMSDEMTRRLGLPQMVARNTDNHCTAFTESIDHVSTSTGISAFERSVTARKSVEPGARPEDFRRPGHMFPLRARPWGVLERDGHTEATVDLMRIAGLEECGLCCEIMRPDGDMMRTSELIAFAGEHGMKIITVEDLISYRRHHEKWVERVTDAPLPTKYGKGVLVTPTIHGNLLIGPTAIDVDDREGTNTTAEGLEQVIGKAGQNVKNLPLRQVITSFAGLRAHEDGHEFLIGELEDAKGFIDCAGIESPGLTSCPAIGEMVAGILKDKMGLELKEDFKATRKGILDPDTLTKEERAELIRREPAYGNIICRCEMITEGEIIDAIRRPLGAKSLDGVKRRTRAGMGRCQSGFCSPRTMEILARELGVSVADITKTGGDSKLVVGINKDTL